MARLTFTLTNETDKSAYPHEESSFLAMSSVAAPTVSLAADRPPLEIVAVIDVSGSMQGQKMELMKQTLKLLVTRAGLRSADMLGIVTFSSDTNTALPLTKMDGEGLQRASGVVSKLQAGGGTNLSGGLLQGIDMLQAVRSTNQSSTTRAVLLFTDGQANGGICDPTEMVSAAEGALTGAPTAIFTFGFGSDHNEDLLQAISAATSSLYYFIQDTDSISSAFADCLGGLLSVVAQNVTLELKTTGGEHRIATIRSVLGNAYTSSVDEGGAHATVQLGDLYSEDEKDVLYELKLHSHVKMAHGMAAEAPPPVDSGATPAADWEGCPILEVKLRFFCVAEKRIKEVKSLLSVCRSEDASQAAINTKLDAQRNRLLVAEALKTATSCADQGKLSEGKVLLDEVIVKITASVSADSDISRALVDDVRRLRVGYQDQLQYNEWGSKLSRMTSMSHSCQRSTHDSPMNDQMHPLTYRGGSAGKGSLKRSWSMK